MEINRTPPYIVDPTDLPGLLGAKHYNLCIMHRLYFNQMKTH